MFVTIRPFDKADVADIRLVYKQAFAGAPWFEKLTDEQVRERWLKSYHQAGFAALVALNHKDIVGSHWRERASWSQIAEEWGDELGRFACDFLQREPANAEIIWERHLSVQPGWHDCGIGTRLRRAFLDELGCLPGDFLVLTRMRTDNIASIRTAEKVGFLRTGVEKQSRSTPQTKHEFWYCMVRGRTVNCRAEAMDAADAPKWPEAANF